MEAVQTVVDFWRSAGPRRWFARDDAFDEEFRRRFLDLHYLAARRGCEEWLHSADGALALQILLAVCYTVFVVFRCMGRDYEATVICSGFGGIALGSTATAIANMSAIVRVYGAAPRAFLVVPLVCGFFIDLVNALVIGVLAR